MLKKKTFLLVLVGLLSLLVLPINAVIAGGGSGGGGGGDNPADTSTSPLAANLDASVLIKWMQLLYDRVEAESISAPAASRLYAYAGITAFQSVLPGIPAGISMSGQLTNL